MATVATRREKEPSHEAKQPIDLTPTGLLMEGHSAQNLCRGILSEMEIYRQLPALYRFTPLAQQAAAARCLPPPEELTAARSSANKAA
jgi:hypothetical protein